jgi:uncharacterized protein YkuJ
LKTTITNSVFTSVSELPSTWDDLAVATIFLQKNYLQVLELSKPENMECFFIGFYKNEQLVGIALAQFLDLNKLASFGERDKCFKTAVRNFVFKKFCSHVLFIGNNMLTGQNAFRFGAEISIKNQTKALLDATADLKKQFEKNGKKIHIVSFKDFEKQTANSMAVQGMQSYFQFSAQPNMVFSIKKEWQSETDYVAALTKKYRDQYKRARKKLEGIDRKKLDLEAIIAHEETIYNLYEHVAKNAPFNTFFLAKNHFSVLKENLGSNFLLYGYFMDQKLVGFSTLIKNGAIMDTYFLGYDNEVQKEKMLYLNMLYDMVAYSINKGFKEIVFARTALEIKSSIGAKAVDMFGFIKHETAIIDSCIGRIFNFLEPKTEWKERNPFK